MQQITSNKASEILNMAIMTIIPENTIYDTPLAADEQAGWLTSNSTDVTNRFVNTYQLPCIKHPEFSEKFCALGAGAYYVLDIDETKNPKRLRLIFRIPKDNYKFAQQIARQISNQIHSDSEISTRFDYITSYDTCTSINCLDTWINNEDNWGDIQHYPVFAIGFKMNN